MWKWYLVIAAMYLHGCDTDMPVADKSELIGSWTVEFIDERPVIDRSPAFIQFTEDDMVSGNATCNRFTGSYSLSVTRLSFGQTASTRMACPPALMEQEQRFLDALGRVAQVTLENGMLELTDANGALVFKASPRENKE
jgi:heat shock protein HslJ